MTIQNIVQRSAAMYSRADSSAELETECLFGELFEVLDSAADYTFGRLVTDGYQGWIPTQALGNLPTATHRLIAPASWVRDDGSVKSPSRLQLSLGSCFAAKPQSDGNNQVALAVDAQGVIAASHSVPIDDKQQDWVSVAESLIGVPYLWGGRTSSGLDCSALVQLAAQSGQITLPRNSSQQQVSGSPIDDPEQLQRGDLVFWRGHVGVMQSATQLLHANAHQMQVASEPLAVAAQRISKNEGPITALRRLVGG